LKNSSLKPPSSAAITPIAHGRTAEIYSWEDGRILKLFRDWCPPDWVDYEARIARALYAAGVPSPAAGEIVEIDGRRGLIYERLDGISMLQDMNTRPWLLPRYAHQLAELQVQINRQSIPGLPSYKDRLEHDIHHTKHLTEEIREKALSRLAALPEGQNLCHGDYHPGNILLTNRGPVVIDWMTACTGDPCADVARTSLLLTIGPKAAGDLVSPMIKMAVGLYYRLYRKHYHSLVPDTQQQVELWLPVIAAARLNEDIDPEREAILELIKKVR
jgi:Ser/Thr protein kinase RdoA (MazF antagonist)